MSCSIGGNQILFDGGGHVDLDHGVGQVVDVLDVLVVVLDVPPEVVMTENVSGISWAGSRPWQIERIASAATDPVNCDVGACDVCANLIRIANWNGVVVTVDVMTGKVSSQRFGK